MSTTTAQQAERELAARPGDAGAARQQVSVLVPFLPEVALEQGVHVLAVFRWPEGVCDERQHRSGARSEFDGLVVQAAQVIRLPLIDGTTAAELKQEKRAGSGITNR